MKIKKPKYRIVHDGDDMFWVEALTWIFLPCFKYYDSISYNGWSSLKLAEAELEEHRKESVIKVVKEID